MKLPILLTHLAVAITVTATALTVASGVADAKPKKKRPAQAAKAAAKATTKIPGSVDSVPAPPPPSATATRPGRPGTEPVVKPGAPPPGGVVQRESKIEFDERLVQGQTAAGAIYLFQRGESEFLSMVEVPATFRERTIEKVFLGRAKPGRR